MLSGQIIPLPARPPTVMNAPVNLAHLKTACSTCNLRELGLPVSLDRSEVESLDDLVYTRKKVKRGEALFRGGDPFTALRAWRSCHASSRSCNTIFTR